MQPRIKISDLPDFDMAGMLQSEEDIAIYLSLVLEGGDPAEFNHALDMIDRARFYRARS